MEEKHNSEEEQRIDNQVKKMKIELETGAKFFTPDGSNLPADVEALFLDNILAMEHAAKNAEVKTVNQILGYPIFLPSSELNDKQIEFELERFFRLLDENDVELEFIYDTPDREVYNFISGDFLAVENEMVQLPGMTTHFVYEEFVPNEEEDLKSFANDIIVSIFNKGYNFLLEQLAEEVYWDSFKVGQKEYVERLIESLSEMTFELSSFQITDLILTEGDTKAELIGELSYTKSELNVNYEAISEKFSIEFIKEYDFWSAERVSIPSLRL